MKKKKPLWLRILLIVLLLGVLACLWEFASSQNPYLLPVKRALKYDVLHLSPLRDPARGLDAPAADVQDGRTVYATAETKRLVNYLDGYAIDLPADTLFDSTLAPLFTRAAGEGYELTISRETAKYESLREVVSFELSTLLPFAFRDDTVRNYVNHYEYRFLLDEGWQRENRVTCLGGEDAGGLRWFFLQLDDPGDAEFDRYFYATVFTKSREYLHLVARYRSDAAADFEALLPEAVRTMRVFDPTGAGQYQTDAAPVCTAALSDETQALYDALLTRSEPLKWGIFTKDVFTTGVDETIPALETALDYRFDVVLGYIHFNMDFPTEFLEKNYAAGRLVELTWQLTENNNEDMFAHTPMLDIYRGERDEEIRAVARAAKAFGHPFLLRLNNEMNSDWTSYSGVVNLSDPRLYVSVWQRIFDVFAEEGVDNCLWIFNPHDRSAPPTKWNDGLAYWPGGDCVHLLGVTGYNNGTYYTQWNEQWRDFTTIYDEIEALYAPHFSRFPWIITEFASSSVGGDKVQWIDEMFAHIGDYPNIRIAVWFSYADFDGDTPARRYWLDETPETLVAFRRGLHAQ